MPKSKHISNIHKSRVPDLDDMRTQNRAIAQAGFWELDVSTGVMCWSLLVRALFEVPENYEPDLKKLLAFCVNESERKALNRSIADCVADGIPFETVVKIKSAKGHIYSVYIMGKAVANDGKFTRVYGSIRNMAGSITHATEEKRPQNRDEQNTEILEAMPDMLLEIDASGNVLVYHAPVNMDLFQNQEKMVGRNIADLLEHGNGITAIVKRCLRERQSGRYEFTVTNKERISVWEARIFPVGTERSLLLIRDITKSEKENEEIQQNEQKFTRLIESMNIGLMEVDTSEKITLAQKSLCKLTGYSESELLGANTSLLFLPIEKKINKIYPERFEVKLKKKNGEILDVLISSAPIYNTAGQIKGAISILYDTTTQKRISRLLEESSRIGKVGIFEFDIIQNKVLWNSEMRDLYETDSLYEPTAEDIFSNFTSNDDRKKAESHFQNCLHGKNRCDDVFQITTKKGNQKWIRLVAESEVFQNKTFRIIGIAIDVTRMMLYEKELEAHTDLSDTILSSIQDGFFLVDETYNVLFINESGANFIGREREAVLGKNIWNIFPEATDLFFDAFEKVKNTGEPDQMTHYLYTGDIGRWFSIKLYPTRKGGISVFYRDVSKEKEAEESIRNLNDRYNAISAATNQVIYEWNFTTQQIEFNEVYYHVTGYKNTPKTRTTDFNLNLIHAEDRERAIETLRDCLKNKKTNLSGIFRFKVADGTFRNMHSRGIIRYDKNFEVLRILGTIEDITERERLNEKLIREQVGAQRRINEAVLDAQEKERAFIGRELHDNVNQILTTASLYLELAESESFQSAETIHQIRSLIRKGIEEIRMLSRQLTPPILHDIGLSVAIRDLVGLVVKASSTHFSVNMGADIVHELSNEKSLVLYRICQELLNNVIKYSGAINCFIILEKTRKKYVRLIVKDDGKGFDANTTKKGIGLNSTVSRVEIYGGSFQINSSPGKGCTVIVEIPL